LKVVGAFHGLSRERSDARKYPAIHPLESWSKYTGIIDGKKTTFARDLLFRGEEVNQMMKVVGEEGTSLDDYIMYQKSEFLDSVYLQQDSFDPVDGSAPIERQKYTFDLVFTILHGSFKLSTKQETRNYFNQLRQRFLDLNSAEWNSDSFKSIEESLRGKIDEKLKTNK